MADNERIGRVSEALRRAGLDAIVCTLPMNVLTLSGYWPVLGTAIAICTQEGQLGIVAPIGEKDFVQLAEPAVVEFFAPGSLQSTDDSLRTLQSALTALSRRMDGFGQKFGIEFDSATVPTGYSGLHIYGSRLRGLLHQDSAALLVPADKMLARLRAVKTARELERVRLACDAAHRGFAAASSLIKPGMRELDIALAARHEFALPSANQGSHRGDGFAWCMSGPNSADADAAFARSQSRQLIDGDCVLLHANSYLDGYWTDITRTFIVGTSAKLQRLFLAVGEARQAALESIRPGVPAKAVDAAARSVFRRLGLADRFTHGLGHEVGFGAINASDIPRLHPASPDILEEGMTFNIEPAVYFDEEAGIRHCDVVEVTRAGCEVLTPWLPLLRPD